MAALAPAVAKLMQRAVNTLPIARCCVLLGPGLDLLDQRQALRFMLGGFSANLLEPGFDDLVRGIAGLVKLLPQSVIGGSTLVRFLPLVPQAAQGLLHLAAPQGLPVGTLEQRLGLGHQFLAHLVGTPALPALQFTGSHQRSMHLVLQRLIDVPSVLFEHGAQSRRRTDAGLAVALRCFTFQSRERFTHGLHGFFDGLRGKPGFRRTRRLARTSPSSIATASLWRQSTCGAQFVGPDGHRG